MASPGPGYNPEVSLLQGGTAPILPVQGGGSMEAGAVPAGYKPDVSLLNTHVSAQIVAVKGGGPQKGGEELKAYQDYVVESYTPPLEMIAVPELPSSSERRTLVNQYTELMKPSMLEVKSLEKGPEPFSLSDAVAPTYQRCATESGRPRVGPQFLETVRKRVVLIDTPEPQIWIIPQMEGRVSRFLQYMKLIPRTAEGKIQSNMFVIFTGSFFSTTTMNDNFNLYHQFLLEKVKSPKNLYILNQLTSDFITISCNILRSMYSAETLRAPDSQQKPLSTFFEPDVIVFTKPQILLRNSELPVQREDSSVKLSKILSLPKFPVQSFLIVPSKDVYDRIPSDDDTDIPAEKRYFFLSFQRTAKEIKTTLKADIKCPEGSGCQGFTVAYKLVEIGDDRRIDSPGLFLLWKNPTQQPFFKGGAIPPSPPPPPGGPEAPAAPEEPPAAPTAPPKPLPAFEAAEPAKPLEEPFVADPTTTDSKSTLTMELNGIDYTIRIPYDPKVKEDWKAAKFTEGEATFLNAMQLTSALLSETFGSKGWKPKVAEFLLSLTRSNCFKDPTLLSTRECSSSQEFVKRVYLTQYNRSLKAMYEKLGMPTPDTLEDLLAALKRLGRIGPTKGTEGLTKDQFTGDLLNRFATILYNPETKEYTVDLVEMPEDVYAMLMKLKFYRAESKSYEDIRRVILEQQGIPIPEEPTATPPPPPPPEETLYTIQDIQEVSKISQDAFDSIYTTGDGLCFYRAVLKGLLENPPEDKDALYVPTEKESLTFIKQIKEQLEKQKQKLLVKADASRSTPVETYFNEQFAPKAGEPEEIPLDGASQKDRDSRIRVGDVLKKMSFADYLKAIDDPDPEKRPYAEVHSAGIGTLAAKLTRTVIVVYVKLGTLFNLVGYYNEEEAAKGLPINRFIFLDHVGGNHYNLLKLKEGVEFPKKEGGGEERIEIGTVKILKSQTRKTRNHLGNLTRRHARHDH